MARIAWFSPLTQLFTLQSARFSMNILPKLERHHELEVFVDDAEWRMHFPAGAERSELAPGAGGFSSPIVHFHRFAERDRHAPFDFCVYHLEDHPRCDYIERTLSCFPGLCICHDLTLNRLYQGRFKHATGRTDLDRWMKTAFGLTEPFIGEYHVRKWPYEVFDASFRAGAEARAHAAVAAVCCEDHAAAIMKESPRLPCAITRQPVVLPLGGLQGEMKSKARALMGFEEDAFLVGYLGNFSVWDAKLAAVEGFQAFKEHCAPAAKLIRLKGSADDQADPRASFRGNLPFTELSAASYGELVSFLGLFDAVIATRCDAGRGLPFGVHEALALGIPVICTDCGPAADLPADAVLRLEPGPSLATGIRFSLQALKQSEELSDRLGRNARAYAALECDPEGVLQDMLAMFVHHRHELERAFSGARARDRQGRRRLLEDLRKELRETYSELPSLRELGLSGDLEHFAAELGWLE